MKKYILITFLLITASVAACDTGADFTIEAKYTYIRSYIGGGGIFVFEMTPVNGFSGYVDLQIDADAALNAELTRDNISNNNPGAEIIVNPGQSAELGDYKIELTASNMDNIKNISFTVAVYNWGDDNIDTAAEKRDQLTEWIENNYPQFGDFGNQDWSYYMTYPEVLIVEHWTFLSEEWEMRICYHVMIPPSDWSMILLRRREAVDAIFAARREYDEQAGSYIIREIPVSEYPVIFAY